MKNDEQKQNTIESNTCSKGYEEVASQQETVNNANVKSEKEKFNWRKFKKSKKDGIVDKVGGEKEKFNWRKFKKSNKDKKDTVGNDKVKLSRDERQKFKREKLEKRLERMSPKRRERYEERKKKREEVKEMKNGMTRDELIKYKSEIKSERVLRKDERMKVKREKVIAKMDKMDNKQLERFNEKLKSIEDKRAVLKSMSKDEKMEYKMEKREKTRERKEKYAFLAKSWTETLPCVVNHLIIDGNNLRGGGPGRHSRDDVIGHVKKVVDVSSELNGANIICMFDRSIANYERVEGIDVQFSGDVIADDIIVKIVKDLEGCVVVVTCDRGLALRILDLGGKVIRNKSFTSIVEGFSMRHR